jgi:SAM-dependent methyltransferase
MGPAILCRWIGGIYKTRIFPRVMDKVMSSERFGRLRRDFLAEVSGRTLEIGSGTGLNLPFYPAGVGDLTTVEINPGMRALAARRDRAFHGRIDARRADGEALPFDDGAFDTVVSTWTLCSIPNVAEALREIRRVLGPHGRFLLHEHGLSPERSVRNWQRRWTPVQRKLADGCHLDRDIPELLARAGFDLARIETFYMEGVPRIGGYMYRGIAVRS